MSMPTALVDAPDQALVAHPAGKEPLSRFKDRSNVHKLEKEPFWLQSSGMEPVISLLMSCRRCRVPRLEGRPHVDGSWPDSRVPVIAMLVTFAQPLPQESGNSPVSPAD